MIAYAAGAVAFTVAFLAFCIGSVWLIDRVTGWHIRRTVTKALDNGDARALHVVREREQVSR